MCAADIQDIRRSLDRLGRYGALLAKYDTDSQNRSTWFEMVFAYWLEDADITPQYEQSANPANNTSVDFVADVDDLKFQMELVRIEHSDEVRSNLAAQASDSKIYGTLFSSNHSNKYFQTASQLIRLQEKILEKIDKFGRPPDNTLSMVVVDCSNINGGMLDIEDVRMTAYGRSRQHEFQEYFGDQRLKGLFEKDFAARTARQLRENLTAVVFLKKLAPDGLSNLFLAVNPAFDTATMFEQLPIFAGIKHVQPAP